MPSFSRVIVLLSLTSLVASCAGQQSPPTPASNSKESSSSGTLSLVANGEDFVRQGFVSKDGWRIDLEKVEVTLAAVTAYQTEPPFDPHTKENLKARQTLPLLEKSKTIDLAAGGVDAAPIEVATVTAPSGGYNALAWQLVPSAEGKTILLEGQATKGQEKVNFRIGINQPLDYVCGEFVGEERKGWLEGGAKTELETTFHFDHLFGSAEVTPTDPLNQGALGFAPLAKLAKNGQLSLEPAELSRQLSPADYDKLTKAIAGLGHVGEGHCQLRSP